MAKKNKAGEDGHAPLLRATAKDALLAAQRSREEADEGVGNAILGLQKAADNRRANML